MLENDTSQDSIVREYHLRLSQGNDRSSSIQVPSSASSQLFRPSLFFSLFFSFSPFLVYIDMDENDQPLTLQFRLPAGLQSRMWEMRIVQLDFEQRAPTGCLQYFEGNNGTLKSLNFLSNGRFLANQDYLLCIRQERGMCGISYSPCSPDSFRIGPSRMQSTNRTNANASLAESSHGTNFTEKNSTDTGSMNVTDNEGSGSNSMDDFLTSMNTSNPMEQEADSSEGSTVYGQERCRDRVLIPCDFEEFITVMFSLCLGTGMPGEREGSGW